MTRKEHAEFSALIRQHNLQAANGWFWNTSHRAWVVLDPTLEENYMPLLIPDETKTTSREDYVFAVPLARVNWNKWYALSNKLGTAVKLYNMRYVVRMIDPESQMPHSYGQPGLSTPQDKVKTIIVLPTGTQTDEDAVAAAAYLRLVEKETCLIYIVRCTDDPPTARQLTFMATGLHRDLAEVIQELEDPDEEVQD